MKVYEAVATGLAAEGCDAVFGVMGDGNMMLWSAIAGQARIEIVSARNEAGAVAMADGYSRTTGKVGLATVTYGPGLTQVGTSLRVAARNRSQLVLVIGQVAAGAKNDLYDMDQRAFCEACGARFQHVTSADNLADEIAEAFYAARVQRRPVVINLPVDLQERSFDWDFTYRASTEYLPARIEGASDVALAPLLERLVLAERPIIVAGRGARTSGARDAIIALAERTGALLATTLPAKDWFAGEPYAIGISGTFASAPAERLLSDADFILGIGAELGYYSSEGGLTFPTAEIARIDIQPVPEKIGILPGLYVAGDAKQTVAALNRLLDARGVRKAGYRTQETRNVLEAPAHAFDQPGDGLDPRSVASSLSRALPAQPLLTCGSGHFLAFPAMYTSLPYDAEVHFSYHFGAIGQALPLAIGVGFGNRGRPHVAIEGDGSLLMNIQEFDTVARYNLQLVLVVWNDSGYGAEAHKLRAKRLDPALAQWRSPDFVAIARAFGGDGERIRNEADLVPAVRQGLAKGGLYVIDIPVSPSAMSDPYAKIHFGLENRAPLVRAERR